MALKIRLRQQGRKNGQTYRVVVADERVRRDGKYLEKLGWYLPYLADNNCSIDGARVSHWLDLGAKMSEQVEALVAKNAPEVLELFRKKREERKAARVALKREKKQKSL